MVLSCGDDCALKLWDMADGTCIRTFGIPGLPGVRANANFASFHANSQPEHVFDRDGQVNVRKLKGHLNQFHRKMKQAGLKDSVHKKRTFVVVVKMESCAIGRFLNAKFKL